MNPFVRFVFTVLVAGMGMNLLIVLTANAHSARKLSADMAREKAAFADLLDNVDMRLRRADIVVESQQVDARGVAIKSTLLVRQYAATGSDQSHPFPVERVEIAGNKVAVDGLVLKFDDSFAPDTPALEILRGKTLAYFFRVYGEGEQAPAKGPDTRFSFLQQWQAPVLTRLDPRDPRPSYYEQKLWPYVWGIVKDPPATGDGGWQQTHHGIDILWTAPAIHAVTLEHTYSAYISPMDGTISIEEDSPSNMPGLLDAMLEEGKKQLIPPAPAPVNN